MSPGRRATRRCSLHMLTGFFHDPGTRRVILALIIPLSGLLRLQSFQLMLAEDLPQNFGCSERGQ